MTTFFSRKLSLLLLGLLLATTASAGIFERSNQGFIPVNQAFNFDFQQNNQQLTLSWKIKPGYYLYRQKIEIIPKQAQLSPWQLPKGQSHHDDFFGASEIYPQDLTIPLILKQVDNAASLQISYQGCAAAGFCYPPEVRTIPLSPLSSKVSSAKAITAEDLTTSQSTQPFSSWWALLVGIGVAFTPCVLPMYPLISAFILGERQRISVMRTLFLALLYVQGMAITYTLLGLLVASVGVPLQASLQSPISLTIFSLLFVVLALSMFGVLSFQLPAALQTRLALLSTRQSGGSAIGVFIMGVVAGLICSPCTTAPLSAILLYIAQSGNPLLGGFTLYLYALGMGLPLIAVTVFGNKILPKRGPWLETVKQGFGFVILALPILLLERILGDSWELRLWSLLIVTASGWAFTKTLLTQKSWSLWLAILWFILALIAVRPLQDAVFQPKKVSHISSPGMGPHFTDVNNRQSLGTHLSQSNGRITMLDLYADWCVACKEFDKYTFRDPQVIQQLGKISLLRADMTENSSELKALLAQYQVLGLPTILFFDAQGNEIKQARISGFLNAKKFQTHLKKLYDH